MSLPKYTISSADWVAAGRAWHLRHTVPLFEDPYAAELSGRALILLHWIRPLEWLVFKFILRPVMPPTMCILMRARYAEESLELAMQAGIRQYVILGAGMDSFAFRRPDLLEQIRAFEVDHPVTQGKKIRRIERAGWKVPANHFFVPADFSEVTPVRALAETPFDGAAPAFVSLLGVSYYLTSDELAASARSISGGMCPGTRIVMDYLLDVDTADPKTSDVRRKMLAFFKKQGEPMRSSYSMDDIRRLMTEVGFKTVENFRMTDLTEAYTRDLPPLEWEPPDMFGFAIFEVA